MPASTSPFISAAKFNAQEFCRLLFLCQVLASNHVISVSSTEKLSRHKRSLPSAEEAQIVLDAHNEVRATVGDEGDEPIPANMKYMTWDDQLAVNSLEYAKKCDFQHSHPDARKTKEFTVYNGENLWAGSGDELVVDFDPVRAVMVWFNEYEYYEFYNHTCVPGKKCGHYTQVVWADSYKLGCAWIICPQLLAYGSYLPDAMYMVCQYAPGGNIPEQKLYKVGERCSMCDEGDTCPNGTLCHNAVRDKIIPLHSTSDKSAGIVVGVLLLLLAGLASAYFVYVKYQSLTGVLPLAWRRRRRISSAVNLKDSENSLENNNGNKREDTPNKDPVAVVTTRIPSANVKIGNSPD